MLFNLFDVWVRGMDSGLTISFPILGCRVGVDFPTVEVRFDNINIEAGVYVGNRALPTLINYSRNVVDVSEGQGGVLRSF